MIHLQSKTKSATLPETTGITILDLAKQHELQWLFNCSRGTCARCRCQVTEGMDLLSPLNDKEYQRLMDDEIEEGYRLACQAKIEREGKLTAINKTYF